MSDDKVELNIPSPLVGQEISTQVLLCLYSN